MSDFDSWFEEQFGKPPFAPSEIVDRAMRRTALKRSLDLLDRAIDEYHNYWRDRRAALYAWQARQRLT